jgi:hypothetical protein
MAKGGAAVASLIHSIVGFLCGLSMRARAALLLMCAQGGGWVLMRAQGKWELRHAWMKVWVGGLGNGMRIIQSAYV